MKKILFVVYGGGHSKMVSPVVKALSELNVFDIYVLALTSAKADFLGLDIKVLGYKDFFRSNDAIREGMRLSAELDNVFDVDETYSYLGENYLDLVRRYGEKGAEKIYKKEGRQSFFPVSALKTIISEVSPDLVITTDSPRSEKAALYAAREMRVDSIALITMFPYRCSPWLSIPNISRKLCVISGAVKDYLVHAGRPSKEVVVTGNPAFDSLCARESVSARTFPLINGMLRVLWASQDEPREISGVTRRGDPLLPIMVEEELIRIFSDKADWELVVRNHPNEIQRDYPKFVSVSPKEQKLEDLLDSIDIVITMGSTVGLQGAIMGTKLITIDQSVYSELIPFSRIGFSTGVENLCDLELTIKDIVSSASFRQPPLYSISDSTSKVIKEIQAALGEQESDLI